MPQRPLRVLHLAAGNRWTGAAAPAFAEVEALREAGVDAHYAYVGGYKLETKIGHHDFARPVIEKAQNPISFLRTAGAIRRMVEEHHFDIVHAHLTYDHWLARMSVGTTKVLLARTFHARRVLRSDPFTRSLMRSTAGVFVVNATFANAALLKGRRTHFTPPPLDTRQFDREGPDARADYGISSDAPLLLMIGKLSEGRGFEEGLQTFALVRDAFPNARLMIIGHGEHRPHLEQLSASLGVEGAVTWAGYHETDLAEHYRAADAFLFTARGSDEGHRAVLEAMGCGLVPLVFPIDGMEALLGDLAKDFIAAEATAESLAKSVGATLSGDLAPLQNAAWSRSRMFDYAHAAKTLRSAYEELIEEG